jgi:hypothetical protein
MNVEITRCLRWTTAFAAATMLLAGCGKQPDSISQAEKADAAKGVPAPSLAETKAIAEEGFIYGLPIVMNYAVEYEFVVDRNSGQFKAPFNQISNEARVFTYKDTAVVTPNSDTPYSMLWLDLRAEPMVVSVPAIDKKRYYSVQFVDSNTYNYTYVGSRATGNQAGSYLVAGPNWQGETPAGVTLIRAETPFGLSIVRTQLFSAADMPNVIKVQAGYKAQPLSAYLHQAAPPAAPAIDFPKIDKEMVKTGFFQYLDFALQFIPASAEEADIRAKLARIGIGPGKTFDFKDLSAEHKAAVALGMKEGDDKIAAKIADMGKNENGWLVAGAGGNRAYYAGDWLKRAAIAKAGIYANDPIEAMYPITRKDLNGEALDGSKHSYTLTFAKGQFPPVNAFWSVTMYDGKSQLLIENPINRYLINSPMLPAMTKNHDGSLTIYIQSKSPGKDKEANWLPAPDGPIYMVMRLYWPKTDAPSILPPGEGSWSPPGVVQAP